VNGGTPSLKKVVAMSDLFDVGRDQDRDGEAWRIRQQGLGDAEASGQATLDGGIRKEGSDDGDV
jgi:hypothetical protein